MKNQDALFLRGCRGGWIAVLADGLGSKPRSWLGSATACRVSGDVLRTTPDIRKALPVIHDQWLSRIAPITPSDVSTTCQIVSVNRDGYVVAAQLGDGLILLKRRGVTRVLTPQREGFGNETNSLKASHHPDEWTISEAHLEQSGDGVVAMTDGIADDLLPEALGDFVTCLADDTVGMSRRRAKNYLRRQFMEWPTPRHGDDKTMLAIFRVNSK